MTGIIQNSLCTEEYSELRIHGGVPLSGSVEADSAKNSVLQLMAATCLMQDGCTVINKVPEITDVLVMKGMIKELGFECSLTKNKLVIRGQIKRGDISKELASQVRASIVLLGPILTTVGEAVLPLPGGDKIGDRPVDIHLECLSEFGIDMDVSGGVIYAKARELPLKGTNIFMRFPSVLATGSLIMAAVLAKGQTVIQNAAREPEIVDLSIMLSNMGARIFGAGTSTITIHGVDRLGGVEYEPIPDRIEAGTLLTAIAISGGRGMVKRFIPEHNSALLSVLRKCGVKLRVRDNDSIFVAKSNLINPIHAIAMPFPGLATDLQPIVTSLATQCPGESIISDTVFPERFSHIIDLQKLGAKISHSGNQVRVTGKENLIGTSVEGNDIRSVTSLICAGLAAEGSTRVKGIEHLYRGHSNLINKLRSLNAQIELY